MEKKIIFILILLIFFSLFIKYTFSDYKKLDYKNYPLLNTYDGYRFLRWAKEINNGVYKYNHIDSLKNLSCGEKYRFYPLISLILAFCGKIFGSQGINIGAVWLSVIVSMFAPFILFFIFYKYYSYKSGIIAYLSFYTSFIYYSRTNIGRYDTDMLILFWVIAVGLFFLYGFEKRKLYYILYGTICYYIFMWWYYKYDFAFLFIAGILLSCIIYCIKNKLYIRQYIMFLIIILIFLMPFWINSFTSIFNHIKAYSVNIYDNVSGNSVPLSSTIVESKRGGGFQIVSMLSSGILGFMLSIGGIFLFYKKAKYLLFFLPLFIIGLSGLKFGQRFLFYLVPIMSWGLGYCFVFFEKKLKLLRASKYIEWGVFALFLLISVSVNSLTISSSPVFEESIVKDLIDVRQEIKGGFLYNWWDEGDFFQAILEMPTLMDNEGTGSKGGRYFLYSYSLASNSIDSLIVIAEFLKSVKCEKYDSIRYKYKNLKSALFANSVNYAKDTTDMYLIFVRNMLMSSKAIFYLAGISANNEYMKKSSYKKLNFYFRNDTLWRYNNIKLNLNTGQLTIGSKNYPVRRIVKITNEDYKIEKEWKENNPGYTIEYIVSKTGWISDFLLLNELVYESNFNRIFIKGERNNKYEFVLRNLPYVCLVKLKQELR